MPLGFLAEEGALPFILARSLVHLLQEGSGCCAEPASERWGSLGLPALGGWGSLQGQREDTGFRQEALGRGLLAFCQTQAVLQKGPPHPPMACLAGLALQRACGDQMTQAEWLAILGAR